MQLTTKHHDARIAAARLPALQASLALLNLSSKAGQIALYDSSNTLLVSVPLDATTPGTIDNGLITLTLTTPLEAQAITDGTADYALITDGVNDDWAQATVSTTGGAGEIQLPSLAITAGSIVRITSAVLQG